MTLKRRITRTQDIALEHCLWAKFQGLSPRTVIRSVGLPEPTKRAVEWSDALASVRASFKALPHQQAAE